MKLGRTKASSVDGDVNRIVAVHPEERRVVDLVTAEARRLLAKGASKGAAYRLAHALFPPSMSDAIALGDRFLDSARETDASRGADASYAIDTVEWQSAADRELDELAADSYLAQWSRRRALST